MFLIFLLCPKPIPICINPFYADSLALLELRFTVFCFILLNTRLWGGVTVVNVSNYTRYIFYSKFTEKSKVICLVLSLSRRPLNVLHDASFYASLPILTGKKCYFCGFNHIVILEIV